MDSDQGDKRGELKEEDTIREITPEENLLNSSVKPSPSPKAVGNVTSVARKKFEKKLDGSILVKSGEPSEEERNRPDFVARDYGDDWDLLCYIKERDIARAETIKAKAELSVAQVKLYDMTKRIEKLERQLAEQHVSSQYKPLRIWLVPVKMPIV